MPELAADRSAITPAELQLATRNHGMPLEALREPITPLGLHYLLVHYAVPRGDPHAWRLAVGGHVGRELSLSLDELRQRPAVTLAVTMECAGNGRAHPEPRPVNPPRLVAARAAPRQPAVAGRGGRDGGVDRDAAARVARGGRPRQRRRGGRLHRA